MAKKQKLPPLPPGTYEVSVETEELTPPLPAGTYEAVPTKYVITKGPYRGRTIFGVGDRMLINVLVVPFEDPNDAL